MHLGQLEGHPDVRPGRAAGAEGPCEGQGLADLQHERVGQQWTNEATCPPFYSNWNPESGAWQSCNYAGVVSVRVNGAWWSDVYVDVWGGSNTSTHYSDAARAQLTPTGQIDPTYDNDAAAYVPPPPPPPEGGGGG